MEEQGSVWKRFWRRQFAGAALVWCAGPGPGGAAEAGGAGPRFGRGGGGACWSAERGSAPGALLLARCLVKSRGFALPLSSCPHRCAWTGAALSLASGGQVPLLLPPLSGCREGPGHGAVPGAWVRPARLSLLCCQVGAKAGVPAPPAQTRPISCPALAWRQLSARHRPLSPHTLPHVGGCPPLPLLRALPALDWAELGAEPWTKGSFPVGAWPGLPGLL